MQVSAIVARGGALVSQLDLFLDEQAHWTAVERRFVDLLRDIVERKTLKETAYVIGIEPSTLAHALSGKSRHALRAEWVPRLLAIAPDDEALAFLAALRGKDLVAAKPMDADEEVNAWRAVAAELPADFRALLENKVRTWRRRTREG